MPVRKEANVRTMLAAALSLVLVLTSCAPLGRSGAAVPVEQVPVVVENQNFYQATVFAIVNSSRVRLGEVQGNSRATFTARAPATGQMRIEVRLLAVGAFTSWPVSIAPGDTVQIRVPPDLHRYRGRPR
jgi:hypothetical protein